MSDKTQHDVLRRIDNVFQGFLGLPYLKFTRDSTIHERARFIIDVLKNETKLAAPYRILDVGCGSGINLVYLSKYRICDTYIGIDLNIDPLFLNKRYKYISDVVFSFDNQNIDEDFHFDNIDVAICTEVLEHLVNDRAALEKIVTSVRTGGLIILTMPSLNFIRKIGKSLPYMLVVSETQDGGHVRLGYDREEIMKLIGGMKIQLVSLCAVSPYDYVRTKRTYEAGFLSSLLENLKHSIFKKEHIFITNSENYSILSDFHSVGVILRKTD